MNFKIQLLLYKDNFLKNIVFIAVSAITVIMVTLAVTGFSNYKNAKKHFPDYLNNIYIYIYDSTLYDMNMGTCMADFGHDDYSEIMKEREDMIRERFDVDEITSPEGNIYLTYFTSGRDQMKALYLQAYDYGNPVFRGIPIDITEGRLPEDGETNVIILPSSYKSDFKCDQTYDFFASTNISDDFEDQIDPTFRLKVIGFFENPILPDPLLKVEMDNRQAIVYLSETDRQALMSSSTIFLIKANTDLPSEGINEFMKELGEDPEYFYKYDPSYEYGGQSYSFKDGADELKNKVLLSVVLLFAVIMANTYLGLDRITGYIINFMKIGLSRKAAIMNVLINHLFVIIPGLLAGTIIFKCISYEQYAVVGGVSVSEFYWSTKYAIIAFLLCLTGCLVAHIPFIVKVLSIELQREE